MHSTHERLVALLLLGLGGAVLSAQAPAGATAKCKDGTYSTAKSSQGRCSRHGGVAELLNTTSTSTSSSATTTRTPTSTATAAGGVPIGATFQCKDGSYSTAKTSSGACSRHGGVDHPLNSRGANAAPTPSATSTAATGGAPANATFQCKDGSYSTAKTSQGACSRHGGVDHALTAAPAAPPAAATPAAAAPAAGGAAAASGKAPTVARPADAPANATAKCRDGTYSASQTHSGSCSHHGGVAEWYQ